MIIENTLRESGIEFVEREFKRYIKFLSTHSTKKKIKYETELHHILPKSLFPNISNLTINKWNGIHLKKRAHYVAHAILMRVFPEEKSLQFAYYAMSNRNGLKVNSRLYAKCKSQISEHLSKSKKGKPLPTETLKKMKVTAGSRNTRILNIWRQFNNTNGYTDFNELEKNILSVYHECWQLPSVMSKKLNISEGTVKSVLKLNELSFDMNEKKTKVFNKYSHLFTSYEDYVESIVSLHNEGLSVFIISETLKVNSCGVESLLSKMNLLVNKDKRKTGPKLNKSNLGMKKGTHIWITNGIDSIRLSVHEPIPTGFRKGRASVK